MKHNLGIKYGYIVTILLIILAGCAIPPPVIEQENYRNLAHKTLTAGIRAISQRYIDPILVSDIAIEGLRGLESIDENFKVNVTSSNINIKVSENSGQNYPKPLNENLEEWAKTMVDALEFSRAHSFTIGNASKEAVFTAVFDGSLSLLDAFSRYSGAKQATKDRAKRSGFGGIGVIVKPVKRGALVVTLIKFSPADLAGIQTGDIITHVDGILLKGWRKQNMISVFRGEIGSFIDVTIERNNRVKLNYSIKREKILLPTVKLTQENRILRIQVSNFYKGTARQIDSLVKNALRTAENPIAGMILDLRGNSGGMLSQAIKVADLFLVKGKILTTWGRHPSSKQEYLADKKDILAGRPLIILINGRSASASEIVAAALQDHKRTIIVGTSTFGKGSIQTVSRLPNDGELTLTWSRFLTPSGYFLHNLGVPTNVCSNGENLDVEKIVFKTLRNSQKIFQLMEAWQEVPVDKRRERMALRQNCPASNKHRKVDIEIAETLILDTNLFSQILDITSSLAFVPN